jgi:trehalose 2-sulfotransferase
MKMQPHTSYLVCGTPRSGSSLLCEALSNTGIAGQPEEEYFLPRNELVWQERWGTSTYAEYLENAIKQCTTPNGVFGAKMMWGYFDNFVSKVRQLPTYNDKALSVTDLMQSVFPNLHYIWIKRSDKVRQAVSHAKARQTDVWKMVTETKPLLTTKPAFSFKQIDFMVQQLEAQEAAWQKYFAVNGIQPFIVVYEHFVQKYEDTAIQILEYLDISGAEYLEFAPRRMKKQSNEESERWVQRYHYLKMQGKRYRIISYANRLLLTFLQTSSHRIN